MPTTQANHGTAAKRTLRKRSLLKTDELVVTMEDGQVTISVPGVGGSQVSVRRVGHYGREVLEISAYHHDVKLVQKDTGDDD